MLVRFSFSSFLKNLSKRGKHGRVSFTTAISPTTSDEYTETPQYPPILDLSFEKRKERENQAYWDEIKAVKTVEEKQIKLNMPRYYGFRCYMFHEDDAPYDNLPIVQHITRTHLIRDTFPEYYNSINVDSLIEKVRPDIEEAILLEWEGYRKDYQINGLELSKAEIENNISIGMSTHINRVLLNNLCKEYPHLTNTMTDPTPRIESFWFVGGMIPHLSLQKSRKAKPYLPYDTKQPVDRAIQFVGKANLTLRSELPLCPVLPYSEAENSSFDVPYFKYDPGVVGVHSEPNRRIVNLPGYFPGESHRFGLMSYHSHGYMHDRKCIDEKDNIETLHRQGILSSFGWLNAQAHMLGFTTYNDITYPMVTQCAITNGQHWRLYIYQLNTLLVNGKSVDENPKRNVCWATQEFKLFEEIKDGKVIGLNEDVLKLLCKFYANVPQKRVGVDLTPYLSKKEKLVADYKDEDKRVWLEREYKFLTSNRSRHHLLYEIYNWEKIYKIDHNMRPFDARRRPFETFVNPMARTLDDRHPRYIPRKFRPHLPRHKGRFLKEYFP